MIIGSLGRRDYLLASGELDGLLRSLAKFSKKLRVVRRDGSYSKTNEAAPRSGRPV